MVICSHIDDYKTKLEAARQSLDEASRDYYESVEELQQFATGRGDEQESGWHCHIKRKRSRLNEVRGPKDDHAAFRAYVSSCQTAKAKARIIR
jgi:hypothetical protein